MTLSDREAIFGLWDGLADFSASQVDEALLYLMRFFKEHLLARDVVWVGAARVGQGASVRRDRLNGWRGLAIRHYDNSPDIQVRSIQAAKMQESSPDETTCALVAGAGKLRVHRLYDGFVNLTTIKHTEQFRMVYGDAGIVDRIFAGVPVNADAESFLLIDRYGGKRFSARDAEFVEYAMRGLKWFHRELLLANGLLIAEKSLSPTERRIIRLILAGLTEREIADKLGQSPKTTHKYIAEILRKYGVRGRTGLMARWLNRCG